MQKTVFLSWTLLMLLSACAAEPALPATASPMPSFTRTATAIFVIPVQPTATEVVALPAATVQLEGPFSSASHSTDIFHLQCDPLDVIFDVTTDDPKVSGVSFFFRMKDKSSGMTSQWSNGDDMRTPGNNQFEFILNIGAIPDEARFQEAWLEYQFVAMNRFRQPIGRSQIFTDQVSFTLACP